MALNVRRAGASDYGRFVKALVVGEPGSGKTRSASTWPNPLYANVEGGMMSVTDRQPPVIDVVSSIELGELLRTLEQQPAVREKILGVPVETVIVDTIDQMARILVEERLASERKEAMAIQDWGWLGDQLRGIVRGFRNLNMHVILNCHVKSQEDSDSGKVIYKPAIQGAMGDEIAGYVDLALLLTARPRTVVKNGQNVRELARVLQTFPDGQHPWIKDRSGKLPMEFPIDLDSDFQRMSKLIFAEMPAEAPPVQGTGEAPPPAAAKPDAQPAAQATKATKAAKKAAPAPAAAPAAAEAPAAEQPPLETQPEPAAVGEEQPTAVEEQAPAVEPAPEPEAATDESAPATEGAPAEPDSEPQPDAETPLAEESVPADGTPEPEPEPAADEPAKPAWQTCQSCGGTVESKDQADLAFIRFREHLCRKCFAERKKAKAS